MDPKLIIRIFANTNDDEGEIATAYPVAKDLIITARHAIFPEGKTVQSIELRWYWQEGEDKNAILQFPDCLAWNGADHGGVDVVLLKCTFPAEVTTHGRLSCYQPEPGIQWTSQGFAKAVAQDKKRPSASMLGEIISSNNPDGIYELGAKYSTEEEIHWKGVSGCPVFIGDKNHKEIIAIVTSCPKNFNAAQLRAVAVWKLFELPEFRSAICAEIDEQAERENRKKWARKKLLNLLTAAPDTLKTQLSVYLESEDVKPQTLADSLLDGSPLADRLDLLNFIRIELLEQEQIELVDIIRKLLNILLPTCFDQRLIALLRNHKDSLIPLSFSERIVTETASEIIMAGVDDRPVMFACLEQAHALPVGVHNHAKLLPAAECGFRGTKEQSPAHNFRQHMIKHYGSGKDRETAAVRVKHLANRSYDKQTLYCTYSLPKHSDDRQAYLEFIAELQADFKHMIFIQLEHPADNEEELDLMNLVADMQPSPEPTS